MDHDPRFEQLCDQAKQNVQETDIDTVKKRMEAGESFLLIDVREESEWNQNRLPNAVHLGKGIIERDIHLLVNDPNQEMVLYCGGGYRSALAAENLQKMGYTQAISMDGGIRAWRDAGYPIEGQK